MRGLTERVAILRRVETGEADPLGAPVVEWEAEELDGALVRPLAGSDLAGTTRPDGVDELYSVALSAYDGPPLRGCRVALVDRGMDPGDAAAALRIVGSPDVTWQSPLVWNIQFTCGRAHG